MMTLEQMDTICGRTEIMLRHACSVMYEVEGTDWAGACYAVPLPHTGEPADDDRESKFVALLRVLMPNRDITVSGEHVHISRERPRL